MHCGPSKSAGRSSGGHCGVATNRASTGCSSTPGEHADASGLLNHQNPLLPALLSIDLEQEGRLDDHEERLEELEAAVAARDDQERAPTGREPVTIFSISTAKASSAVPFLRPEFWWCRSGCTDGLDERITDDRRRSCRCRRRSAADATASPPPAGFVGRWLAVNRSADSRGRPDAPRNHASRRIILTNSLYG